MLDYNTIQKWKDFRSGLNKESCLQKVLTYYNNLPEVSWNCDPYDRASWPNPWELVTENTYCRFRKILGICYTLQLSDVFSDRHFEIHIGIDNKKNDLVYILSIDKLNIGSYNGMSIEEITNIQHIVVQDTFIMDNLFGK